VTAFNFSSGNPVNLTGGAPASMADIQGSLTDVQTFFNSRTFNEDNLPVALLQRLGLNDASGQKGRGKSIIAASESRTNAAYGLLPTPDRVSGIVLPADGLIFIGYQSTWFESVALAARAAIFIGANQLKAVQTFGSPPQVQEVNTQSSSIQGTGIALGTSAAGLRSESVSTAYAGDVTTGQVLGVGQGSDGVGSRVGFGFTTVFAAAGTYDVSVQFKASSGSVSALGRKLWVWTLGF
jgi:hypothetical protein